MNCIWYKLLLNKQSKTFLSFHFLKILYVKKIKGAQ
jgi:hypothetical protein